MIDNDDKIERQKFCISPLATRPVLYTDTIQGGNQAMRDDLWAVTTEELNRAQQDALDAARYRWIEENARTNGGGHGFTITAYVPFDEENMGCGIDKAIAAEKEQPK